MHHLVVLAVSLPLFALLFCGFVRNSAANRRVAAFRAFVTLAAGLLAVFAMILLGITQFAGPVHRSLPVDFPVCISVYIDGISAAMLTLVAAVGWVICRFSIRYLDAEPHQGRYFRWTAFTIGSVSLSVVAGNLVILAVGLLMTSLGLHQLLTHYEDRPVARRAAAIKFVFSRLGDACLLIATVFLYREFGTFELPQLFTALGNMSDSDLADSDSIQIAAWSIVLCAVFKSAQFPFHTWLPETMEAPTPVSALMHAGIVNAGGYLLIRLAPIVVLAPAAMWFVAGLGLLTALFAALVMMSQTSVKQKLAWSTIAQMGFMIFQCGLGAFSAAMLHIIAHSLYKAHAFLSSGNVMNERAATTTASPQARGMFANVIGFIPAAAVSIGMYAGLAAAFGMSPEVKPGGMILGFVMCAGIANWMRKAFVAERTFVVSAIVISAGLMLTYFATFTLVDSVVASSLSQFSVPQTVSWTSFSVVSIFGFAVLLIIESFANLGGKSARLSKLYMHSSNGFYVDILWRRAARAFMY